MVFFLFSQHIHGVTADGEGLFGIAGGLEGDSGGASLPGGSAAGGIDGGLSCLRVEACACEKLLQHRLAAGDLGDYGVFFSVFGDAAVSNVIAVPTSGRVDGIEFREVNGRDVASDAVDEEPSAALPLPVR